MEKNRKIVKMGGSFFIKLFPIDMKDNNWKVKDEVDIGNLIKVIKKKEK
jgi:hypothetical protein